MSSADAPVVAVLEPGYTDYETERRLLERHGARVLAVAQEDDAVAAMRSLSPVAALVRERPVTAEAIAASRSLKLILRYGVGVDNIDLDAAASRRIYVANIPDYGADQVVSDQAVALYLAVARRVVERDREVRGGAWGLGQSRPIAGHHGATAGLVGFGRIARATWTKLKALGFSRALVFDPYVSDEALAEAGAEACDLDTLCERADLISLHTPLTDATRRLIDHRRLALMKPTAILINVSRGGLIDDGALADALRRGALFGAGLDVFEAEPIAPDHPLLAAPNTVISDHTAWYSEQSVAMLQTKAAEEVGRVLDGAPPLNWVNRWPE